MTDSAKQTNHTIKIVSYLSPKANTSDETKLVIWQRRNGQKRVDSEKALQNQWHGLFIAHNLKLTAFCFP